MQWSNEERSVGSVDWNWTRGNQCATIVEPRDWSGDVVYLETIGSREGEAKFEQDNGREMQRSPFEEMASSHRSAREFVESDRISIGGVHNQFPFVNTVLSSSPKKMKSSRSKSCIQVKLGAAYRRFSHMSHWRPHMFDIGSVHWQVTKGHFSFSIRGFFLTAEDFNVLF